MKRKLTTEEIELLNQLANDKDLACKWFLERYIIRNTYEPKYKVNDYVKITDDTYSYIYGNRITNVNAKIVGISWMLGSLVDNTCVLYECHALDQDNKSHTIFATEDVNGHYSKTHITGRSMTDKNFFEKKSKYSQSTSVSF